MTELLPCPFCGGAPKAVNMKERRASLPENTQDAFADFYIRCDACDFGFYDDDPAIVWTAWNTRTQPKDQSHG